MVVNIRTYFSVDQIRSSFFVAALLLTSLNTRSANESKRLQPFLMCY